MGSGVGIGVGVGVDSGVGTGVGVGEGVGVGVCAGGGGGVLSQDISKIMDNNAMNWYFILQDIEISGAGFDPHRVIVSIFL